MSIEALKEASKRFPDKGELNFKIAQVYYSLGKNEDALAYSKIAIEKGGLSKPLQTFEFIAYLAYEQHQYDFAKGITDGVDLSERHLGDRHLHQALLNFCRDGQLLAIAFGGIFGLNQGGVLDQRGCAIGDGAQNIVAHRRQLARQKMRIQVQHALHVLLSRLGSLFDFVLNDRLAQGNADHAVQVVRHDTLAPGQLAGIVGIGDQKLGRALGRVTQNRTEEK